LTCPMTLHDNGLVPRIPRDNAFTFRMPVDLREALDRLADAEGRSLSDYLNRVLAAHVAATGTSTSTRRKGARHGVRVRER
jgi:predicted transcriptional regulator